MANMQVRTMRGSDESLMDELESEFLRDVSSAGVTAREFAQAVRGFSKIGDATVVTVDGVSAGYCLASARRAGGEWDKSSTSRVVTNLAVLPKYRGQGAGSTLLKSVAARSRKAGVSILTAHTSEDSRGFYERCRWTVGEHLAGVAWIEEPSLEMWREAVRHGLNAGESRKVTFVRHMGFDEGANTAYPLTANLVLAPKKLRLVFQVPFTEEQGMGRVYRHLGKVCDEQTGLYEKLPEEVREGIDFHR